MEGLSKYDDIRPYTDEEAREVFKEISRHPAVFSMIKVFNPYLTKEEVIEYFESMTGIDDFQRKFSYPGLRLIIGKTSEGLTHEGLDNLDKDGSYLFVSTHRDIMLDTSLLNFLMLEQGMKLAEAAIGDNLIKRDLLSRLAKLNRNFVVKRNAPVREMVLNSKHLSEYIQFVLHDKKRSVWIAQREGRTKDGIDATNPGLLKMITMAASRKENIIDFLKSLKIVPLSISYEYDPTDRMKIDELIAKEHNMTYLKDRNEDFQQIVTGIIGQKKRMHLAAGKPLDKELDQLEGLNGNKLLQKLAEVIDAEIIRNYKLWPSNYIAYNKLMASSKFENLYNDFEERSFLRRIEKRAIQHDHDDAERKFLEMYANPVINNLKLGFIK
ncbi:MAG: 1-acyl-sn-glycerol-3-phosphate acyltransferase [Bacteroidota bacterium]